MPISHLCRNCKSRLTIPGYNGEPTTFFCTSELTKLRQHPIGFLSDDAPACEHFDSRNRRDQTMRTELQSAERQVVYYIASQPTQIQTEQKQPASSKHLEVFLAEKIGMISTIVILIALTAEHLKPYIGVILATVFGKSQ